MAVAIAAAGCSDSPVETTMDSGGAVFTDVPEVPRPATPGGDVPATSAILSVVRPYEGAFNPRIDDAYGNWLIIEEPEYPLLFDTHVVANGNEWISKMDVVPTSIFIDEELARLELLNEEGAPVAVKETETRRWFSEEAGPNDRYTRFIGSAPTEPVYIRRDRRWEVVPLEGTGGSFLLLDGETTADLKSIYSSGVSRTETEEFGRSVTGETGLDLGALSAKVSGTLTETFTTSVEVWESKSEEFGKSVSGKAGKWVQFMVWELVEVYTFCDRNGDPWDDPNYHIAATSLERHGAGVLLQVTEFDR
jgi:hypothetical protein